LVKDYRILGDGEVLFEVANNWQRKRVHLLPNPQTIQSLRIEVATTHGVSEARIFEVRVY
jgi:hypothetical protein